MIVFEWSRCTCSECAYFCFPQGSLILPRTCISSRSLLFTGFLAWVTCSLLVNTVKEWRSIKPLERDFLFISIFKVYLFNLLLRQVFSYEMIACKRWLQAKRDLFTHELRFEEKAISIYPVVETKFNMLIVGNLNTYWVSSVSKGGEGCKFHN